jgi:hypothetical protein
MILDSQVAFLATGESAKSRWTNVPGLREINVYTKPDGTIDYMLVKVLTL